MVTMMTFMRLGLQTLYTKQIHANLTSNSGYKAVRMLSSIFFLKVLNLYLSVIASSWKILLPCPCIRFSIQYMIIWVPHLGCQTLDLELSPYSCLIHLYTTNTCKCISPLNFPKRLVLEWSLKNPRVHLCSD